ncbi:hypothetical protein BVC71_09455 [Marivivens niveibacter]|uniref:Uncharacterized protein n=1 Tax=Marivivens niveibacter TaxID=1930667 RepID=A0A251WY05_9RHOB|nr:hypothetical protein [Marivivens niveibacter]OUD08934.1 hypothetical protein BVC71_09455 [Marivivens niveibacter]
MTKITSPLHTAKTSSKIPPLEFKLQPANGHQPRYKNRIVPTPDFNLGKYTFKAVIDWVEVEIRLTTNSQVRHIQHSLLQTQSRKCFVKEIDGNGHGTSQAFRIKFQEPESLAFVAQRLEKLAKQHPYGTAPQVVDIEVSVDAYSHARRDIEHQRMVGLLTKTLYAKGEHFKSSLKKPRFTWGKLPKETEFVTPDTSNPLPPYVNVYDHDLYKSAAVDATFYLGARKHGSLTRIMHKVIDTQTKHTSKALAEDEKRARIEVRTGKDWLRENELTEVADFRSYSFTKMQGDFFQFKLPLLGKTTPQSKSKFNDITGIDTFRNGGTIAVQGRDLLLKPFRSNVFKVLKAHLRRRGNPFRTPSIRKEGAVDFISYSELSKNIRTALQNLTDREGNAWRKLY